MGKSKKPEPTATEPAGDIESAPEPAEPSLPSRPEKLESTNKAEETDFETFYLKQITAEFADDLDKLRNANDFNEKSMPILIDALKSAARTYSEEEKNRDYGAR
ncbi:MAG: hypothetical protein Q9178_001006 [Gyalolechia marmorata]